MQQGELEPPHSYDNLARWASRRGIEAMGVGSPFSPRTAALYRYYEDEGRSIYYDPSFDPQAVKHPEEARALIDALNHRSGGDTLFYLDNETPKARYGHMWWVGWHHDMPAWHDYDQPFDRWMCRDQAPGDDRDEPVPYQRRPYMQILAHQRAHGALGMWAHPTSWWRTDTGAFVTNIASEMPAHLAAEGTVDGLVIMGYDAFQPSYLNLWHHLLDAGYRVPGVAETDIALSTESLWNREALFLTHVYTGEEGTTLEAVRKGLRAGHAYVSSGPGIALQVDEHPPGAVVETSPGRHHRVTISLWPSAAGEPLGTVDLLGRGGVRLWAGEVDGCAEFELSVPGRETRGYLIARVFGRGEDPDTTAASDIRTVAITNPAYLHPPGLHFPPPATTAVSISASPGSPFRGGAVTLESPTGEALDRWTLTGQEAAVQAPANGRLRLQPRAGTSTVRYLINENRDVQQLQRYLYRGRFLRDFPHSVPGHIPAQAFRPDAFRRALQTAHLRY